MPNQAAQAFIAVLRCEAHHAEERAKSLRSTAAAIEANNPGPKRKRKRLPTAFAVPVAGSSTKKVTKAPSAFSLFVHEHYESTRKDHHDDVPSSEIVATIQQQWQSLTDEEKQFWKCRAEQQSQADRVPTIQIPGFRDLSDLEREDDAESAEEEEQEDENDQNNDENDCNGTEVTPLLI